MTKKKKPEGNIRFAESLKVFIESIEDDPKEQELILKKTVKGLEGLDVSYIDPNCSKCYGRGFLNYNRTFKYLTLCKKCITRMIQRVNAKTNQGDK